jgi:indole-3-glycerol phosphate synthase
MSHVLERICADKRETVAARKAERPLAAVEDAARQASAPRGFMRALAEADAAGAFALICEIKKASPSKGLIRGDFDPAALARAYADGGASCLSVLTDAPYFQGDDDHLVAARAAVELPVLRKDFMLDPYQIAESRALGADCVLLIMAALSDAQARELAEAARGWGMDVLAEVHDGDELERALALDTQLIGINNRDLKTLQVDTETTRALAPRVPADRLVVCESGLRAHADLVAMREAGSRAFLIGEHLMQHGDVVAATRTIMGRDPAAEPGAAE